MCGSIPKSQSKFPPYLLGKSSGCIKDESVDLTSCFPSINIFETVTGSNHRLIQPQTVGKKAGAPIICRKSVWRTNYHSKHLHIFCRASQGSVLSPIHWHLACEILDSRTVSALRSRYRQCWWSL